MTFESSNFARCGAYQQNQNEIQMARRTSLFSHQHNLGGTKVEELVFTDDILQLLDIEGLKLSFIKTGHLITSLDMAGLSVTLCQVKDKGA